MIHPLNKSQSSYFFGTFVGFGGGLCAMWPFFSLPLFAELGISTIFLTLVLGGSFCLFVSGIGYIFLFPLTIGVLTTCCGLGGGAEDTTPYLPLMLFVSSFNNSFLLIFYLLLVWAK
jgi:hypothetical protein